MFLAGVTIPPCALFVSIIAFSAARALIAALCIDSTVIGMIALVVIETRRGAKEVMSKRAAVSMRLIKFMVSFASWRGDPASRDILVWIRKSIQLYAVEAACARVD